MNISAFSLGASAFGIGGALLLTQCSSASGNVAATDASAPCPVDAPNVGTPCTLPESTQCNSYATPAGECPTFYVCNAGTWSAVGAGGVAPECPSLMPEAGSPCVSEICTDVDFECPFTCAGGGTVTALCEQDQWQIATCPGDAGITSDAGIDDAAITDASDSGDGG